MPTLTEADLRDPSPPVPGAKERAAVATRAQQLGRRRRMLQGAVALGMVAAVAVGVAALTAGGSSAPGGRRFEAASPGAANGATSAFTVSGAVANIPDGVTVTVTLTGDHGTFTAIVNRSGQFSIGGVAAGDYAASYEVVSTDGTATSAGKLGSITVNRDLGLNFALT